MFSNLFNSFQKPEKRAFIKINKITCTHNNSTIFACVGPRKLFRHFSAYNEDIFKRTWEFTYNDNKRSSFVIALFQTSTFGPDKLLGQFEIRLDAFKVNSVTDHTFILRSTDRNSEPICVGISIHINENQSLSFIAPKSNIIKDEYEIIRTSSLHSVSL